jgi:hypothetical protein
MEKTTGTPKGEQDLHDAPVLEPNGMERTLNNGDEGEKTHAHEPERVVEWGGPNNHYGKVPYTQSCRLT